MSVCRTVDQVRAAALDLARTHPPLTQEQVDHVAAILASTPGSAVA